MKKRIFALILSALILTNATACFRAPDQKNEDTLEDTTTTEEHTPEDDTIPDSELKIGTYEDGLALFEDLSYIYQSVLKGTMMLHHTREDQEMYLGDCRFPYFRTKVSEASELYFTVLDSDGDEKADAVVITDGGDSIVLRAYSGSVYAYDFTFRGMYHLQENGVFYWTSNAGSTYGAAKLRFDGEHILTDELYRVEHDKENNDIFSCYIDNTLVTHEELLTYGEQLEAPRAIQYPMIRTNEELLDQKTEKITPSEIPANAELVEAGTHYRIWRGVGDFYFYYCIYDANGKTVLCERTQRPLKISMQGDSVLDISVSMGTGNSTTIHRFYDPETNRFSTTYSSVEAVLGDLVLYLSRAYLNAHVLKVEHMFDKSVYCESFMFDFAPMEPALESSVKSLALSEDGKSILISYLAGKDQILTHSRIPLEKKSYIPDEKISADFASYDSIIQLYQKMVETTPLFFYSDWGKGGTINYDALFEIPNETAKEWYDALLSAVTSYDIQEDHFYQYGYTIRDLNGDGINELILRQYNHRVLAVFSMADGKPVLLGGYRARHSCWIDPDGFLRVHGSSGAAYFDSCVYQVANGGGELILLEKHGCDGYDESTGTLLYYKVVDGEKVRLTEAENQEMLANSPYTPYKDEYEIPDYLEFVPLFDKNNPAPAPYAPIDKESKG